MKNQLMRKAITVACAVLAAGLGACTNGPLEGGRYACRPDAAIALAGAGGGYQDPDSALPENQQQCPQQWRCGLEGYCHPYGDTSVRWRCLIDAHCEGGWVCGLDFNRDGGECHDPAKGEAHACAGDLHCTQSWHCGPAGVCYDRTQPLPFVCRQGRGDCADGWRCGLEGVCHDLDAGQPYPCTGDAGPDDGWCERGWRCGLDGRCVDPARDALRPGAPVELGLAEKINPLLGARAIDAFSVSPFYETSPGARVQTIATLEGDRLRGWVVHRFGSNGVRSTVRPFEVPGPIPATSVLAFGTRGERDNSGFPYIPDTDNRLFVTLDGGGITRITLREDGGISLAPVLTSFVQHRLKLGTADDPFAPRALAFNNAAESAVRLFGDARAGLAFQDHSGSSFASLAGNRLTDVALVRANATLDCVVAADQRGLWLRPQGSPTLIYPGFDPVELGPFTNAQCGRPSLDRIGQLATLGRDWLALSSEPMDGGAPQVSLATLSALWKRPVGTECHRGLGTALTPCLNQNRFPIDLVFGPCSVCNGARILDLAVTGGGKPLPGIAVRCGRADGGTTGFFTVSGGSNQSCVRTREQGEGSLFAAPALIAPLQPVTGQVAWATVEGHVWVGPSALGAWSVAFDRTAAGVARWASGADDYLAFTEEITGWPVAGIGLFVDPSSGMVAPVDGRPAWAVTRDNQVLDLAGSATPSDARLLGVVGSSVTPFVAPYRASSVRSGSGKEVLAISAGPTLFVAELDRALQGVEPYALLGAQLATVGPITSLAFPPVAPAGVYLQGYVVTGNGVLRITAQTSSNWNAEPVPLPSALKPLAVWFDGDRARVGFGDGTVYSLPSRVEVAPPLDGGTAVDYARGCGAQLVLGEDGLFRLDPVAGSAIGKWTPVGLPDGFADGGLSRGRAHLVGDELFVFTRTGETAKLKFPSCP